MASKDLDKSTAKKAESSKASSSVDQSTAASSSASSSKAQSLVAAAQKAKTKPLAKSRHVSRRDTEEQAERAVKAHFPDWSKEATHLYEVNGKSMISQVVEDKRALKGTKVQGQVGA